MENEAKAEIKHKGTKISIYEFLLKLFKFFNLLLKSYILTIHFSM
jgi:hypothetical protein